MPTHERHLVAALVLVVAGCGGPVSTPSSPATTSDSLPSPVPSPAWEIANAARTKADALLLKALVAMPPSPSGERLTIDLIREQGDWAVAVASPTRADAAGEGAFILAWRADGQWHTVSGEDRPTFCKALAEAPPGAVTEAELAYFSGCR